jgi:predicted PurR-regulated permease PerM
MRQVAWAATVVFAILGALLLLWALRSIAWLFILSLVVAAMARGPIDYLMRRYNFSRPVAMSLVYGIGIGGLSALLIGIGVPLTRELQLVLQDFSGTYSLFEGRWQNNTRWGPFFLQRFPSTEQVTTWLGGTEQLLASFINLAWIAFDGLGQFLLAIVLSLYWTADSLHFERLWLSLLAPANRARARTIWRAVESGVGAYLRSELAQSLLAGALLALGFWGLGLRYPFLWSFIIALAWLVPLVGGLLPLLPLWLIVSINVNSTIATAAVFYTIMILLLMEFVVERRLYKRERYTQVLVLLVMLAMTDLYSWFGLLVAPLVATAIQIFLNESARAPEPLIVTPARPQLSLLEDRLREVRDLVARVESPQIASFFTRLEQLMQKTRAGI